jgi:hypothetical protein
MPPPRLLHDRRPWSSDVLLPSGDGEDALASRGQLLLSGARSSSPDPGAWSSSPPCSLRLLPCLRRPRGTTVVPGARRGGTERRRCRGRMKKRRRRVEVQGLRDGSGDALPSVPMPGARSLGAATAARVVGPPPPRGGTPSPKSDGNGSSLLFAVGFPLHPCSCFSWKDNGKGRRDAIAGFIPFALQMVLGLRGKETY